MSCERCKICNKLIYPMDPQTKINDLRIHKYCIKKYHEGVIQNQQQIIIGGDIFINSCPTELNLAEKNGVNLVSMQNNISRTAEYSHPYRDFNNYEDDSDYKQDFYHNFSDPWKVRNDVENNGYIVSEFGEVFSPEQIKYYKKLGHTIKPDGNIHWKNN